MSAEGLLPHALKMKVLLLCSLFVLAACGSNEPRRHAHASSHIGAVKGRQSELWALRGGGVEAEYDDDFHDGDDADGLGDCEDDGHDWASVCLA